MAEESRKEAVAVSAMRRQRRIEHQVGDQKQFTLVLEVPTDRKFFAIVEAFPNLSDALLNCELVKACLVDWRGVKESDLLSSGTDDDALFRADTAGEWIDDHSEWWG